MTLFRQSMAWMHTWTGLLLGWVLFFMFVTGSAGYYDTELDRWMKPEQPIPVEVTDPAALFQVALEKGQKENPGADRYTIRLPTTRTYSPYITLGASGKDASGQSYHNTYTMLADGSAVPEARETGGGQQLYRMHWTFHYIPETVGEFLAGFAAFFMLAAIISGVITHKKIFTDFFTFRLAKGHRTWLDSHNILSVTSLPYQIMITFSGLVFVMSLFFFPIIGAQYGVPPDFAAIEADFLGEPVKHERSGIFAPLDDIAPMVAKAQDFLGDEPPTGMTVKFAGDKNAQVAISGTLAGSPLREIPRISFDGVTGEVIESEPRRFYGPRTIIKSLEGLHEALFAGPILRIVFFMSGLIGCGMVATGLVLWTKKRRQKLRGDAKAELNLTIIERLNVGVIAGLPIAVAVYFWANRVLPVGLEGRADWEINTLFLTWLAAMIVSLARPPSKAWIEQLCLAAGLFALLPILNAATTSLHLGNTLPLPGRNGDVAMAGVDIAFILIGAGFAYAASIAMKKQEAPKRRAKPRPTKEAVPRSPAE